jgi:hypothetical protein
MTMMIYLIYECTLRDEHGWSPRAWEAFTAVDTKDEVDSHVHRPFTFIATFGKSIWEQYWQDTLYSIEDCAFDLLDVGCPVARQTCSE